MLGIYDPEDAEVGQLYTLRFHNEEDNDPPHFHVFDTKDRKIPGRLWKGVSGVSCLVVKQTKFHTIVLVGEDLIHLGKDDAATTSLIPLHE